ncbi:MAG: hypothetical protein U1E78_13245 [Gammaproteobacteria bacterium]
MTQSGPHHPQKGNCSARNLNCGTHALTHRFIKYLMNGQLDQHLENRHYQLLLETFKKIHTIPDQPPVSWDHIKKLCCYYTHPYDREILFGDALREFFATVIALSPDYQSGRQEHFQIMLTTYIKRDHHLAPKPSMPDLFKSFDFWGIASAAWSIFASPIKQPFQDEDHGVDSEFINQSPPCLSFLSEMSDLFKLKAANEINQIDFLERHINNGFYTQADVQEKINTFWRTIGFNEWIKYIKTPYILLPIDVLMNGSAALDFDVEIEILGGHIWHNKIENPDGSFTPRSFSLKAFNLAGNHYEVELDSELETRVHNAQCDGFGIFEEGEKINEFLAQAGIQIGKLQGRKITDDSAPSAEIRRFLRTQPASDQEQASWIASFNTQGRSDRNKPRSERKTVKSAQLSIIEWARFEVSLYDQIQKNRAWVSTWHQALYDLSQIKDPSSLEAWCATHLRPLNPFDALSHETLIGWARENSQLHQDFDPLPGEERLAQPGKTIPEAIWVQEQLAKGDTLSTLLLIYDQAEPAQKENAYNWLFKEWEKYNTHTLGLWLSYKDRPVAYALEAAERILNLAIDLEAYLPQADWPNLDHLEHCVQTNNLLGLYHERQRLYAYQFNQPQSSVHSASHVTSSLPTRSTSSDTASVLEETVGNKRTQIDSRPSTEIDEAREVKKKRPQFE